MELMLAMAVIAMIAALALPSSRPAGGSAALRIKALEIASLLRAARNSALGSGLATTVVLDRAARTLRSAGGAARIPEGVPFEIRPSALGVFRFTADGRATAGALILGSGRSAAVVRVNGLTASVDVGAR